MLDTILVTVGDAMGSVARYWFALAAGSVSRNLPYDTILINSIGSFAIGLFDSMTLSHGRFPVSNSERIFFMVGICGGITTFSSFNLQTLDLVRAAAPGRATLNILASVILCLLAVAGGFALGTQIGGQSTQVGQSAIEEEAS